MPNYKKNDWDRQHNHTKHRHQINGKKHNTSKNWGLIKDVMFIKQDPPIAGFNTLKIFKQIRHKQYLPETHQAEGTGLQMLTVVLIYSCRPLSNFRRFGVYYLHLWS